jgi:antitoxin YefM
MSNTLNFVLAACTMSDMIEVSYSEARARLAELLDRVSDDREVVRIRRQGRKSGAVLIDADEYTSLEETAHLFSSPANVRHLLQALSDLESGQSVSYDSVDELWRDIAAVSGAETVAEGVPADRMIAEVDAAGATYRAVKKPRKRPARA